MTPVDIIVIAVVVLIIGGAVAYIIKAKKSGKRCIGCPYGDSCSRCKCGCDGSRTDADTPTDGGENPQDLDK